MAGYPARMNKRIRQGLGLLVVAALAYVIAYLANSLISGMVGTVLMLTASLTLLIAGLAGAVLLAWGLLRETSRSA